MMRRLALVWLLGALIAALLLPSAVSAAKPPPYQWRVTHNECDIMMRIGVEFTVLGASQANNVILTSTVQQKNTTKWHNGRINGRDPESFQANGQPHVFTIDTAEYLSYGYITTLRMSVKLQAFKGKTLLWQKVIKGISCQTTE